MPFRHFIHRILQRLKTKHGSECKCHKELIIEYHHPRLATFKCALFYYANEIKKELRSQNITVWHNIRENKNYIRIPHNGDMNIILHRYRYKPENHRFNQTAFNTRTPRYGEVTPGVPYATTPISINTIKIKQRRNNSRQNNCRIRTTEARYHDIRQISPEQTYSQTQDDRNQIRYYNEVCPTQNQNTKQDQMTQTNRDKTTQTENNERSIEITNEQLQNMQLNYDETPCTEIIYKDDFQISFNNINSL